MLEAIFNITFNNDIYHCKASKSTSYMRDWLLNVMYGSNLC